MEKQRYKKYGKELLRLKRVADHILDYTTRIYIYNYFKDHNITSSNDCNIKDNDSTYKYIAKGGSGTVYMKRVKLEDVFYSMAIKTQTVPKYMLRDDKLLENNKIWNEMYFQKKCTELVLNKTTQNLPIFYDHQMCLDRDTRIIFYNEIASGVLLDWMRISHTVNEWKSFLFQYWSAVHVIQTKLKMAHNDLRLGNIFYYEIEPVGYFRYTINEVDYYVPNMGYVFLIGDFGSAKSLILEPNNNVVRDRIDKNKDMFFVHDLFNRIRVIMLFNKFKYRELLEHFETGKYKEYLDKTIIENKKRFKNDARYEEKLKISMIYYLIENNRFEELLKYKEDYPIDMKTNIEMPPKEIDNLLKILSNKYNYDGNNYYKDFIQKQIPNPSELIAEFFNEYTEPKKYSLHFVS